MTPPLGIILTSAPSLSALRAALSRARATVLKVVPAWGLPQPWTPATIGEAAQLVPTLIVRTSWGDPSYAGGSRALPHAEQILDELAPWLAARPDAVIELGNEPLIAPTPDEQVAWAYAWHLERTIAACRAAFPRAHILAPAQMINHPVALGTAADGVSRWLAIAGPALRRCDGLSLHAYNAEQLNRGLAQLRQLVSAELPIWLTEFALNETLPPAERARRYRALLDGAPIEAACLYHFNQLGGADPVHHNPNYDLDDATLAALGATLAAQPATGDAHTYRKDKLHPVGHGYSRRPDGMRPESIVIHTTNGKQGTSFDAEARYLRDSPDVSAHYLVGKDGRVAQILPDELCAWHAGSAEPGYRNAEALGIECHLTVGEKWSTAQRAALTALVRDRMAYWNIPSTRVVTHRAIALPPGRKTDPAEWSDGEFAAWRSTLAEADPWAAWGTTYPLPIEQRGFAIPQRWLKEKDLGAAVSPEFYPNGGGRSVRFFARGLIVWLGGEKTEVLR